MAEALLRVLALHATVLYVVGGLLEMCLGEEVGWGSCCLFAQASLQRTAINTYRPYLR
jgi:hypothetical protein